MELLYPLWFNKSTKDKLCKSQYTVGKKKHINCNIGHLNPFIWCWAKLQSEDGEKEVFTAALLDMMAWYGIVKRRKGCRWQLGGRGSAAVPLCHYSPHLITSLAVPEKKGVRKKENKTKLTVCLPKLKRMGRPKECHCFPFKCRNMKSFAPKWEICHLEK